MNASKVFLLSAVVTAALQLGSAAPAFALCDDVSKSVPFHRTPIEDRTTDQLIQTRKFQIECMQSFIMKVRDSKRPENAWLNPCDSVKCKRIFDRCNAAAADVKKYPICDQGGCKVENSGDGEYCFDVFKAGFGEEHSGCYTFVLSSFDQATVGKCWKVQREVAAEAAGERWDKYAAEVRELELRTAGTTATGLHEAKKEQDHSAEKKDKAPGSPGKESAIKPDIGIRKAK